jgi:hypothetical protein
MIFAFAQATAQRERASLPACEADVFSRRKDSRDACNNADIAKSTATREAISAIYFTKQHEQSL